MTSPNGPPELTSHPCALGRYYCAHSMLAAALHAQLDASLPVVAAPSDMRLEKRRPHDRSIPRVHKRVALAHGCTAHRMVYCTGLVVSPWCHSI
eukprot:CAMPEP_0181244162 /NCGR_PEP_ID=MMETSP1096-20121128/42698_1 /TAXON_ID=156174 ORGANISM="Chrysochromulina ericina, Strain CCMP281" /NCGR_SAMPLE_ID=MMETSP1096 /ASSEMBLY_ACC=CAM_ASM_000453 /LENGTH=93 /DNA_ID=CAMNT_0023340663 /DNA_START=90 /DNA_END=371 /DNA_ORIENTATION=-